MMRFGSFLAVPVAMLMLALSASAQQDGGLVSTSELAKSLQMRHERDALSGREVFTGERGEVVLCPSMSCALVNGKLVDLPGEPRNLGSEVVVPTQSVCVIEAQLGKPPDEQPEVKPPGRNVPPAVFKPVRVFKKIVLDPGHGGAVPGGATGAHGTKEKTVNLDIALRMKDLLKAEGIEVVMTRTADKELSKNQREDLQARVDLTNGEQPDAFVAIHNNWISKKNIRGFELYVARDEDKKERVEVAVKNPVWPASRAGCKKPAEASRVKSVCAEMYEQNRKESLSLATEIRNKLRNDLDLPDRDIRPAGFHVIKWAQCPAVLIEVEFLSNETGEALLKSASFRQKAAAALVEAILNFKKKMEASEKWSK